MKLLIILNPNAGHGRSAKKLTDIKALLNKKGITATIKTSTHPGHGTKLASNSDLERYDGLVAAGGDGTLFEVLNGLYQHPKEKRIPLGLLPIGTGNAFARDLGLAPFDLPQAIEKLSRAQTRSIDVGKVETSSASYYFLNILSLGFAVDASQTAQNFKFLGNTAYTLGTLWQTLKLRSYPLVLNIDDKTIEQDNIFLTISNSRYTGTHFLIAPDASCEDGLFDLTLLRKLPRHRLLKLFPTIYDGKHVMHKEIETYQASDIHIQSPAGMLLGPDGEFLGRTPAKITCLHQDLEFFY